MEAAAWETSQGLDPEDYNFQAPWLSFVGHFLPPLGRLFVCGFAYNLFDFLHDFGSQFWVRFWYPKLGLKIGFL